MSQDEPRRSARPSHTSEAGVVDLPALTTDQRAAAERILERLAETARMSWTPRPADEGQRYLPRIDRVRHNNVFLIDGARGSGKTTLMLTLLDCLSAPLWGRAPTAAFKAMKDQHDWGTHFDSVVPLEIVDLQPLPRSTNLILHLLGRLQLLIESLQPGSVEERRAPWHPGGGAMPSSQRWKDLLRAIATGWDGNVRQRSSQLDPEAYVFEMEMAERERLDVFFQFQLFMDTVITDIDRFGLRRGPHAPLLVIPVDDADMNPMLSVHLLELFRVLYHPRLVFLVAGDSALFQASLHNYVLSALYEPVRGLDEAVRAHPAPGASEQTYRLPVAIYDKVIPRGRRFALPALSPAERLYRLSDRDMQGVPVPVPDMGLAPRSDVSAAEALDIEVESENPAPYPWLLPDRARRKETVPTVLDYLAVGAEAAAALPSAMRGLADFDDWLLEQKRQARTVPEPRPRFGAPAHQVMLKLWEGAAAEAELPTEPNAEPWQSWVHIDSGTGRLVADHSALSQNYTWVTAMILSPAVTLCSEAWEGFTLNRRRLPARLQSALLVASWMAYDASDSGLFIPPKPSPGPDAGYSMRFVTVQHTRDDLPTRDLRIGWPTPIWRSLDAILFTKGWDRQLEEIRSTTPTASVDSLLPRFVGLVVSIARSRRPLTLPPPPVTNLAPLAADVASLAADLSDQTSRGRVQRAWAANRAGLLAAPEYGLSPTTANAWLTALKTAFGAQWAGVRNGLRAERRERLEFVMRTPGVARPVDEETVTATLAAFDEDADFLWKAEIESTPVVAAPRNRSPRRIRD